MAEDLSFLPDKPESSPPIDLSFLPDQPKVPPLQRIGASLKKLVRWLLLR
jgi:hypothetical protein